MVKQAVHLRDRRSRDEKGVFLIEGYRELLRASDAGCRIESLFFCESLFLGTNEKTLIQKIKESGAELFSCSEIVFRKLSYRDRPDGLLAIARQLQMKLDEIPSPKSPC